MKKKLALLIAFSLILSLIPASALLAEEADENDNGYEYEDVNGYENGENGEEENGEEAEEEDENGDEPVYDEDEDEEDANGDEDEDDEDYPVTLPLLPVDTTPVVPVVPVVPVAAEVTTLRFVIGETIFTRNDVPQPELEAAPFIDRAVGRTMVPLAAIAEGLGATVGWDHDTRTVTIRRGDTNLVIPVDEPLPGGMGTPVIIAGRTFVPLAYVSEELGAEVRWDDDARAVYVWY